MTAIGMTTFGALPALRITAPDGAEGIVTLYGAHLVSWKSADGVQRLFCSARSALDGSRAIRGGVPVIFPQFAERGTGMRHGFARVSTWRLDSSGVRDGAAFAVFSLSQDQLAPAIAQAWPHAFALQLTVTVQGDQLTLTLDVRNSGAQAFAFSCALHSYLLVDAIGAIRIDGLPDGALRIDDKIDHIYRDVKGALTLVQPDRTLTLTHSGFTDTVVWNPGAADTLALPDMEAGDYLRFVCIEPALIDALTLPPGGAWQGMHRIVASSIP